MVFILHGSFSINLQMLLALCMPIQNRNTACMTTSYFFFTLAILYHWFSLIIHEIKRGIIFPSVLICFLCKDQAGNLMQMAHFLCCLCKVSMNSVNIWSRLTSVKGVLRFFMAFISCYVWLLLTILLIVSWIYLSSFRATTSTHAKDVCVLLRSIKALNTGHQLDIQCRYVNCW